MAARLFCIAIAAFWLAGVAAPTPAIGQVEPSMRAGQKYLFYLHGTYVEESGPYTVSRIYNTRYEVDNIVRAFSRKGFFVVSDFRPRNTQAGAYADRLASEVAALIQTGVPAADITVVGHSKGGLIAMMAAARLELADLNFVLMAACSRSLRRGGYTEFVSREAQKMAGRILFLNERRNTEAGSCREALMRAKRTVSEERVLDTGKGDGLFYKPDPAWVEPAALWALVCGRTDAPKDSGPTGC